MRKVLFYLMYGLIGNKVSTISNDTVLTQCLFYLGLLSLLFIAFVFREGKKWRWFWVTAVVTVAIYGFALTAIAVLFFGILAWIANREREKDRAGAKQGAIPTDREAEKEKEKQAKSRAMLALELTVKNLTETTCYTFCFFPISDR